MTDFILGSADPIAEPTLLDRRLFLITASQSQALLDIFDRPAQDNAGMKELLSRTAPWEE